jgi:hypothetical protein
MINEYFLEHIFKKNPFFYDYISFIGCNNIDDIFSTTLVKEDKDILNLIEKRIGSKFSGDEDEDVYENYILSEKLKLFIKPCTKLLFFEKGKYCSKVDFHKNPKTMYRAIRHSEIFLENFKLEFLKENNIPYFVNKN